MNDSVVWQDVPVSIDDDESWSGQPFALPIPNVPLRDTSSTSELGAFLAIGEAWADLVSRFLPKTQTPVVLDLGCGCGKLARFLYLNPAIRYIGIDLFLPAIAWCRKAFAPLAGERFRFEHFDGYSRAYNPAGEIEPANHRLPCDDCSIDVAVCASLFTHLAEPTCSHYLSELRRVLTPGGRIIVSIHTQPSPGARFSGNEDRIDIDPDYFVQLASQAGLQLLHKAGVVYGQLAIIFEETSSVKA
jgi:SAM-dependent methyltransferase